MKILVLGAGAVGGYFGGRLAQLGRDVTFLVRPNRAKLLAEKGLRISSPHGNATLKVKCVLQAEVKPEYDLVVLTAKAYDLEDAMNAIAPAMEGGRACVLPLLNGMAHLEALDARFGRDRVLGGVAQIASTLAPDGEIRMLAEFHRILFGARAPSQKKVCDDFAAALEGVVFEWKQLDTILQAMWDKWVMLATLAGMTCLMRATVADIMEAAAGEKLMLQLLEEIASVATAEGYPISAAGMASNRKLLTQRGAVLSASMLRDVESKSAAEGDHILGQLLVRARAKGLSTLLLEVAVTNLEAYAARRRREGASPGR